MSEQLYFRQLLSGRDFAVDDPMAAQMVNFVYLVGDRSTREAMIVDPAYAVDDLLAVAESDGMRVVGALVTHHHPDHIGGSFMGHGIQGVRELLMAMSVPVHVNEAEAHSVQRQADLGVGDLVAHDGGDRINVGEVEITLLHTPGHTPGSQCFLVDGRLVAGDTLFLEGCGRTDLPGSNASDMYDSLQQLAALPDATIVYPGHRYSVPSMGTIGAVRESNYVFKPRTKEQWMMMFGTDI